jgi:tRNA(Ile)-lysidine synthetase-like protein
MNLKEVFYDFLTRENLIGEKILLCVSGGIDSMVLLEVAIQTCDPKNIVVFHLDHGMRKNSRKDFLFVQKICSKKGMLFCGETLQKFPQKNKESCWREKRQTLSHTIAQKLKTKRILTAHHATDLVETMIFRFTKGTGIAGLAPFDTTSKPFWRISRKEIETYAKIHNVSFRHDESNNDEQFERNLIRNKVVPQLRKITPHLEKVFLTESDIFAETADFLQAELQNHFESQSIPLLVFLKLHIILQKEFLRHISIKIPSSSEISDCLRWLHQNPKGNTIKSIGGTKLRIEKKKLHWK